MITRYSNKVPIPKASITTPPMLPSVSAHRIRLYCFIAALDDFAAPLFVPLLLPLALVGVVLTFAMLNPDFSKSEAWTVEKKPTGEPVAERVAVEVMGPVPLLSIYGAMRVPKAA